MKSIFGTQEFQTPFVDVFKSFNVFNCSNEAKKGNVQDLQDKSIGRRVFQISGNVQASNFLQIPDPVSDCKSLNLGTRYVYLEFQSHIGKIFSLHLDIVIPEREQTIRFSLSNLYENYKLTPGNILQVPLKKEPLNKWTIFIFDIEYHLENYPFFQPGLFKSFKNIYRLKSMQVCSNLSIRNIYTSNHLYDLKNLPKEMNFKMLSEGQKWDDLYQFLSLPKDIKKFKDQSPNPDEGKENLLPKMSSAFQPNLPKKIEQPLSKASSPPKERFNPSGFKSREEVVVRPQKRPPSEKSIVEEKNPYLRLNHSLGFSGRYCPDIKWMKSLDSIKELVYASGCLIVVNNVEKNTQRFFYGHNEPIVCLDVARDNDLIVSAQEGKKCLIKLWTSKDGICINTIQPPYESIKSLCFAHQKKHLCSVGLDSLKRQVIIIWDLENVFAKKKPEIIAKQISDFDIITIKFSPTEHDKLVSCGKENIRFWRLKNDHIPGGTVVLNHHARNSVFTVLDFEFTSDDPKVVLQSDKLKRVFVGTKTGWLYQINYFTRQMEGIYQVHESSICSLSISPGFCVSGSEDMFLRVWPLDFSEFILEAKHEGIVVALDISLNGLEVACGTSTGGLAVLDLGNQNYKTILRSHTEEIVAMELHVFSDSIITLSRDLTIRIWDTQKLEQNYEFSYPKEDMCMCISACPTGNYFVGGFESGIFRVFDIEKIGIVEEGKYHEGTIKFIQYSPNGKLMLVGDSNCYYCIYDTTRNYQPVKALPREMPSDYVYGAFSPDNDMFVTIGDNGSHINVYETYNLTQMIKIFCSGTFIKKLSFHQNSELLFVITTDCKIRIYGLKNDFDTFQTTAYFLSEVNCLHRDSLNSMTISPDNRYLFTVGADNLIKVWNLNPNLTINFSPQLFIGHANPVTNQILHPKSKQLFTSGGFEGVYSWELLIDFEEEPMEFEIDYEKLVPCSKRRPDNVKRLKGNQSENPAFAENLQQSEAGSAVKARGLVNEEEEIKESASPAKSLKRSDSIKKMSEFRREVLEGKAGSPSNFQIERLSEDFDPFIKEFKKLRPRKYKDQIYQYNRSEVREKFNLPFKHYFLEKQAKDELNLKEKLEKIKDNTQNLELHFLVGYNNNGHQNLIWNYMNGWFAYSIENMIIIERIDKERQQKVINFPDLISVLTLSRDGHKLVIGSACQNSDNIANIYVMDCTSYVVMKTLSFHTRGVQQLTFTNDGKYLISVGNFRESTVAVWDFNTGKMLASSYTLDKINDIKVGQSVYMSDRVFEFCTVGRDQVQFWAFVKDFKTEFRLEYYDVFIKKTKDEAVEITCCDYLKDRDDEYVICGLASGEVAVVQYKTFEVVFQKKVAEGELVDLFVSPMARKIIFTALDSSIYFLEFERFVPSNLHFYKFTTVYPPSSLSIEPELNEGLYATVEGGIYYFKISEKFTQCLAETINPSKVYKTFPINDQIFMTTHENNRVSLWNVDTAEQLHTFNFKSQIVVPFYEKDKNKITCHFENNNEVHILNLTKLGLMESYVYEELVASQRKAEDHPVKIFTLDLNGKKHYYVLMKRGQIYDYSFTEKEYSILFDKIAQIPDIVINEVLMIKEDFIIVGTNKGMVNVYQIEKREKDNISLLLFDSCNFFENPHSDKITQGQENLIVTQKLYENAFSNLKIEKSKYNEGSYFAILNNLQYVYERSYMKREITKRIALNDFPTSLACVDDKSRGILYVSLHDGTIYYLDVEDLESLTFRSFLNEEIISVMAIKKKNKVLAFHRNGICFYNFVK